MNVLTLSIASIRARALLSFLCAFAVACGIGLLLSVVLLFGATEEGLKRNAEGIDIVVGAKGSPLQLVLSSVYHADIPNGNIDADVVEELGRNPSVRKIIPIAVGDNYRGWRIVGTTPDYIGLYNPEFADGDMFHDDFEAVAGASTGLSTGETFSATHGFATDDSHAHEDHPYTITGVLKPTGTVLDRLIVTPLHSVQELHSHGAHHDHEGHEDHDEHAEVTALLLKVASPVAIMNLPRQINDTTNLVAASPSYVMARLMQTTGLGRDAIAAAGYVFLALATFMILSVLSAGLRERVHDLALFRVLGASPSKIMAVVLCESVLMAFAGSAIGVVLGHGIAYSISMAFPALHSILLPASLLVPAAESFLFLGLGTITGLVAGLLPCFLVRRADIANILAQAR